MIYNQEIPLRKGITTVEAKILLAADFANVDSSGKLNIIGAFNRINAHKFPVRHSQMHLVVRLVAELGEFDQQRNLRIILWDEDGNQLWETPDIPFHVKPPESGKRGEHNAIIGLQGMGFEKPGVYSFNVYVDTQFKGSIPIDLALIPKQDASE
jgi:hypothetical protein